MVKLQSVSTDARRCSWQKLTPRACTTLLLSLSRTSMTAGMGARAAAFKIGSQIFQPIHAAAPCEYPKHRRSKELAANKIVPKEIASCASVPLPVKKAGASAAIEQMT